MKIRIEIDENIGEDELVIRCRQMDEETQSIQRAVCEVVQSGQQMELHKGDTSYFLPLHKILFFETEGSGVYAHTEKESYGTNHRLYELEELLPGFFMRVSKSTILNVKKVYSLTRTISASAVVEFHQSHKQVYISRYYYKPLKERLEEKR